MNILSICLSRYLIKKPPGFYTEGPFLCYMQFTDLLRSKYRSLAFSYLTKLAQEHEWAEEVRPGPDPLRHFKRSNSNAPNESVYAARLAAGGFFNPR